MDEKGEAGLFNERGGEGGHESFQYAASQM